METKKTETAWIQVAEIELVYRTKVKPSERPKVRSSTEIYQLLLPGWNHHLIELQEEFKVLLLNRRSSVLAFTRHPKEGWAARW